MPHAASQATRPHWRARIRSHRGTRYAYQAVVFLLGLVVILACLGLWTFLPAPLALPPMLVGVWIWSTEFGFAGSLLDWLKDKLGDARDYAKQHPLRFALITAASLLLAAAAFWAYWQFI